MVKCIPKPTFAAAEGKYTFWRMFSRDLLFWEPCSFKKRLHSSLLPLGGGSGVFRFTACLPLEWRRWRRRWRRFTSGRKVLGEGAKDFLHSGGNGSWSDLSRSEPPMRLISLGYNHLLAVVTRASDRTAIHGVRLADVGKLVENICHTLEAFNGLAGKKNFRLVHCVRKFAALITTVDVATVPLRSSSTRKLPQVG